MTNERAKSELMPAYCDRNICLRNEYNSIGCDECEVTKSQEPKTVKSCDTCKHDEAFGCPSFIHDRCENYSEWEQADGEYILKSEAIRVASGYCHPSNIAKELEKLPTVVIPSSEPKTGHWIDTDEGFSPCECSECKSVEFKKSKFCPNCGAKMVEPQESEDKE